jgi:hypothetical protein
VTHAPVASLNWPAMTMDFILANPALVEKLKAGAPVTIEFVERGPGEWVITKMEAKGAAAAGAAHGSGALGRMLNALIAWSARNKFLVVIMTVFITLAGIHAVWKTPLDAMPRSFGCSSDCLH